MGKTWVTEDANDFKLWCQVLQLLYLVFYGNNQERWSQMKNKKKTKKTKHPSNKMIRKRLFYGVMTHPLYTQGVDINVNVIAENDVKQKKMNT